MWEKLLCNCAYSGPSGVSGRTVGEVMADPGLSEISGQCATEAYAVATARGIRLELDDPVAYVRAFGSKIPNARPSVLLDLLAGRRSEIGVINGAIPRVAKELGMAAPVNQTITSLVLARERQLGCR